MSAAAATGPGGAPQPAKPINVLVVDDSAVVREVMTALLRQERDIAVVTAADPLIAETKMRSLRPDVIVLDLEMPRMDGLTFLRRVMATDPVPVVICSGAAGQGTRAALRAIDAGAVAVVAKPKLGIRGFLYESALMLVDTVRGAAAARLKLRRPAHPALSASFAPPRPLPARAVPQSQRSAGRPVRVVALGASIGGTEALREVLRVLPPETPGIVVVQHMPEGFTKAFAAHLADVCAIEVKEAEPGDEIRRGRALIAPGDRHLVVVRRGTGYGVELSDGPLVSRHRPSVDVLFRSVAAAAGRDALGAIMTGMGDDGADGLLALRATGATTLAQDETSCVVFGMPKEAIARGAVDQVLPLSTIGERIAQLADRAVAARITARDAP